MQDGDKLSEIGKFGDEINVDIIFQNMLNEHSIEAESKNIFTWASAVRVWNEWDLKNTYRGASIKLNSEGQQSHHSNIKGKETLFGVAWWYTATAKLLPHTKFTYKKIEFDDAADVGNYHAGYTGTVAGVPLTLQRIGAGIVENLKNKTYDNFRPLSIRNFKYWTNPPYGDRDKDYFWNNKGMKDALKLNEKARSHFSILDYLFLGE